jgi:hypothetical protein
VTDLKKQMGVRVESEVWRAYKVVCGRESLRPGQPIEDFLRLVVDGDSALSVLRVMREAAKSRVDGFEAYARVLLDWFVHGKFWFSTSGEEDVSVEGMLLDALKVVADPDLRQKIENALIDNQRKRELRSQKKGL